MLDEARPQTIRCALSFMLSIPTVVAIFIVNLLENGIQVSRQRRRHRVPAKLAQDCPARSVHQQAEVAAGSIAAERHATEAAAIRGPEAADPHTQIETLQVKGDEWLQGRLPSEDGIRLNPLPLPGNLLHSTNQGKRHSCDNSRHPAP
ncbi:hypothetical protein [Rhodopila sp.]|uniref:hypothetical protein n=1 Tax=Rhodopila sp. TaxID=2480087 RepID=UPI003D0B06C2